jgi:anti-sigma factor RsiW
MVMDEHNDDQRMWQTSLYLLGELSADDCLKYEEWLESDEALCDELVFGARLLQATRAVLAVEKAAPVHVVQGNAGLAGASGSARVVSTGVSRKAAVLSAVVAVGLMFVALATSGIPRQPAPELLQDAVALSDILGHWEPAVERDTDWEAFGDDRVAMPENPEWLITALDLDEESVESDAVTDEDEAVF